MRITLVLIVACVFQVKSINSRSLYLTQEVLQRYNPRHRVPQDETCFLKTEPFFRNYKYKRVLTKMLNSEPSNGSDHNLSFCEFNLDILKLLMTWPEQINNITRFGIVKTKWYCELPPQRSECNGDSYCLTDECNCNLRDRSVFYCPDNSGCISVQNLCDGIHDCKDGSDECLCEDFIQLKCSQLAFRSYCMSEEAFCLAVRDTKHSSQNFRLLSCAREHGLNVKCKHVMKRRKSLKTNPIARCFFENHLAAMQSVYMDDIEPFCLSNCSVYYGDEDWGKFCGNIFQGGLGSSAFTFSCKHKMVFLDKICDGKIDCTNGTDEAGCPGKFHCSENSNFEWVSLEKQCDNVKDCSNGADECQNCDFGSFTSANSLISSRIVFYLTILSGTLIILLNLFLGFKCFMKEPITHQGDIDKLLRLQVFFFDVLMGLYKCLIVTASLFIRWKGNYCLYDQDWRSSYYCAMLGTIFTFSSHGSLLTIAFMSIIRCITCVSNNTIRISRSVVVICLVIFMALNILNSVIPIVRLPMIQDIFRTEIFLTNIKDNPFFSSNPLNVTLLRAVHNRVFHRNATDIYKILEDLNDTASDNKVWHTTEISYYGNSGLCVHNIFKNQKSFMTYKISYLSFIVTLLLTVTVAYIIILIKARKSHTKVRNISGQKNRIDVPSAGVTMKVLLMIGSQLLSWIPLIGLVIYYTSYSEGSAPRMVFEICALVVIPINSLLNPIFYSGLYKTMIIRVKEKAGKMMFCQGNQEQREDIPMEQKSDN